MEANNLKKITLKSPKNKASVELNNEDVFAFFKGYSEGYSEKFAHKGDNYAPKPVVFEWNGDLDSAFTLTVWEKDNDQIKFEYTTAERFIAVDALVREGEYCWFVQTKTDDCVVKSEVFSFKLSISLGTVFIEGVSNTRDIGGFKGLYGKTIPRGLVYRGGYLDNVTQKGREYAKQVLKIKTDLDLRNEGEGSADDKFSPLGEGVNHILKSGCMYTGNNWSGCKHVGKEGIDIEEGKRKIVEELSVFANNENFPLYTHCVLGRDRTGTLIAVLLAMCGVSKRDIMMEYELSFFSSIGCGEDTKVPEIIGYFQKVLEYLETYDGNTLYEKTIDYLLRAGMDNETILAIQNNMLI